MAAAVAAGGGMVAVLEVPEVAEVMLKVVAVRDHSRAVLSSAEMPASGCQSNLAARSIV